MNNIEVKIVIGANYGDEGKGLATRYFSRNAALENKKCLNVLFNGGPQRGHTVETKDGVRHVFHHFGSGTFDGAETLFDSEFMINPMLFADELRTLGEAYRRCYVSPKCKVTTPYDMFINQIVEVDRGDNRHGSCGCGIWETQERYRNKKYSLLYDDLIQMDEQELKDYFELISKEYLPERLSQYGITEIPQQYKELLESKSLIDNYISDLMLMKKICGTATFQEIYSKFNVVVFEAGQGLALSQTNKSEYPNVTASDTSSFIPLARVNNLNDVHEVEICYVSRSYFTRHGAGRFATECKRDSISAAIEDSTNVPNEFQGKIRYGLFDLDDFIDRILGDKWNGVLAQKDILYTAMFTHLNYTNGELFGVSNKRKVYEQFYRVYESYSKFAEDIEVY